MMTIVNIIINYQFIREYAYFLQYFNHSSLFCATCVDTVINMLIGVVMLWAVCTWQVRAVHILPPPKVVIMHFHFHGFHI